MSHPQKPNRFNSFSQKATKNRLFAIYQFGRAADRWSTEHFSTIFFKIIVNLGEITSKMKNHYLFILIFGLILPLQGNAQQTKVDRKLQNTLLEITKDFRGTVGVYVYHLKTHREAAVNADTIFPTASVVKVPILVGLFDKIEKGELKYNQPLVYTRDLDYGGSGLMTNFKDSTKTDLSVAAALMISFSDNATSLWNQKMAGGGAAINQLMMEYGLAHTRVNSRTPGREKEQAAYGWGQTTPREMATLLIKIRKGEVISKEASDRMYRMMSNQFYDDNALSQIPPYIQTASKTGAVDQSRSELVMVNAPHGDYLLYIATKDNVDSSWKSNNEAWELAKRLSSYLWDYFEPRSNWKREEGKKFSDVNY